MSVYLDGETTTRSIAIKFPTPYKYINYAIIDALGLQQTMVRRVSEAVGRAEVEYPCVLFLISLTILKVTFDTVPLKQTE